MKTKIYLVTFLIMLVCSCSSTDNKEDAYTLITEEITTPVRDINKDIENYFSKSNFKIQSSYSVSDKKIDLKLFNKGEETFNRAALQAYSLLLFYEFWDKLNLGVYDSVTVSISNAIVNQEEFRLSYSQSEIISNKHKMNQGYINNVIYCLNNFNDSVYYEFDMILKESLPNIFSGFNPNKYGFMDVLAMYSNECNKNIVSDGILFMRGLAFYFYMTAQENRKDYKNGNINKKISYINHFLSNCNLSIIDLDKKVSYDNGILVDGEPW